MSDGYSLAVVMPRPTPWQTVDRAAVTVEPEPDERVERRDVFGNRVIQLGIHHQHDRLTVRATSDVTVRPIRLDGSGPPWEAVVALVGELRGPGGPRRSAVRRRRVAARRRERSTGPWRCSSHRPSRHGDPSSRSARALCRDDPRAVRVRPRVHRGVDATGHRAGGAGAASARTSPTWRSAPCACSACRRGTSAATSRQRRPAICVAATRRMRGARCGCRRSAGSTSTRRTVTCLPTPRHGGMGTRLRRCRACARCRHRPAGVAATDRRAST